MRERQQCQLSNTHFEAGGGDVIQLLALWRRAVCKERNALYIAQEVGIRLLHHFPVKGQGNAAQQQLLTVCLEVGDVDLLKLLQAPLTTRYAQTASPMLTQTHVTT